MTLQVGVKLLIKATDDRYLFLKRSASFEAGAQSWDIPGGRINTDEPLQDALAREMLEETGMAMDSEPRLIAAQDIFVHDKNLHVVRLTYIGTASGDITISDEHDGYRWMTKEEALSQHLDPYLEKIQDRF